MIHMVSFQLDIFCDSVTQNRFSQNVPVFLWKPLYSKRTNGSITQGMTSLVCSTEYRSLLMWAISLKKTYISEVYIYFSIFCCIAENEVWRIYSIKSLEFLALELCLRLLYLVIFTLPHGCVCLILLFSSNCFPFLIKFYLYFQCHQSAQSDVNVWSNGLPCSCGLKEEWDSHLIPLLILLFADRIFMLPVKISRQISKLGDAEHCPLQRSQLSKHFS